MKVASSPAKHILKEEDGVVGGKSREIGENELGIHGVGVLEDPLDVPDFVVVLRRPLPESGALTHLGDARLVVVGKDLVLQDGIGDLGSAADEVDLEELRLQVSVLSLVLLESLEEEGRSLLDAVGREEGLGNRLDVDERASFGSCKGLCKLESAGGVGEDELVE